MTEQEKNVIRKAVLSVIDHDITPTLANEAEKEVMKEALEKQVAKKIVKTETCSQACPVCNSPVNNKFCPSCGQRLESEI